MRIRVLQWVPAKLLLLEKSDKPQIELEVVHLDWGSHDAQRNGIWI